MNAEIWALFAIVKLRHCSVLQGHCPGANFNSRLADYRYKSFVHLWLPMSIILNDTRLFLSTMFTNASVVKVEAVMD